MEQSIELLNTSLDLYKSYLTESKHKIKDTNLDLNDCLKNCADYVRQIPSLSQEEFNNVILEKCKRFPKQEPSYKSTSNITRILEAITHPEVIALMKKKAMNE